VDFYRPSTPKRV